MTRSRFAEAPASPGIARHQQALSQSSPDDRIDLSVAPGEIHAILGENGAGKSTLMKIVYGVTRPDAGIEWDGRAVWIFEARRPRVKLGIGMVSQHFLAVRNIDGRREHRWRWTERTAPVTLATRIREVSPELWLAGRPASPRAQHVGGRTDSAVEIVRCLLQSPRLLIMDEPTSVLTPQAVQTLFHTLRRLAEEQVSILYISHKLDEVRTLCDSASVLRGRPRRRYCGTLAKKPTRALAR